MPRDKSWVMLDDRRLERYRQGSVEFLDYAFSHAAIDGKIKCPCRDCMNKKFGNYESVHKHLLWRGMYKWYGQGLWSLHNEHAEEHTHGDAFPERSENEDDGLGMNTSDNMDGLLHACLHPVQEDPSGAPIPQSNNFRMLIEEANTPLHPGCKDCSMVLQVSFLFCSRNLRNALRHAKQTT